MAMRLTRRPVEAIPIDIAPMVDVVFQLLLFFMLTSSFVLHPGIRVKLPKASTSTAIAVSKLVVTLTKDHVLYFNEEVVTLAELRGELERAGGGVPVLIRSDRYAYVTKLIELWDLCRDVGYDEIHIATLAD